MLSYALAIAVAISSLVLFLIAFFMSDIHRKDDFLWSAVGLFYALILWFCARNITGAVLLGQASVSILLISFIWQTLKLRKAIANPEQAIAISNFSVLQAVNGLLKGKKKKFQSTTNTPVKESADVVTESEISIPETTSAEAKLPTADNKVTQKNVSKGTSLGRFFGNKKKSTITNTKLNEILDDNEVAKAPLKADKTAIPSAPVTIKENNVPEAKTIAKTSEEKQEKTEQTKSKETVDTAINDAVEEVIDSPKIIQSKESIPEKKAETIEETSIENKAEDTAIVETPVEIKPVPPKTEQTIVETIDSAESTVQNDPEQETKVAPVEVKPDSEEPRSGIVAEKLIIEQKTSASSLDSLETVEIAEVLEALPENLYGDKNRQEDNIIEVTTTEIDEVIKPKQSDQDSQSE